MSLFPLTSVALAVFVGGGFVALIVYVTDEGLHRNAPVVIKKRIAVGGSWCLFSLLLTLVHCNKVQWPGGDALNDAHLVSWSTRMEDSTSLLVSPSSTSGDGPAFICRTTFEAALRAVAFCLGFIVLLFLGPLLEMQLLLPGSRNEKMRMVGDLLKFDNASWLPLVRDLVVSPVFEEIIYRLCVNAILLDGELQVNERERGRGQEHRHDSYAFLQQRKITYATYLSPMLFGLAHLHHNLLKIMLPAASDTPLSANEKLTLLARSIFQLFYTTLFGVLCNWLFFRTVGESLTGSLVGIVSAHSFCNGMGFPPCSFLSAARKPTTRGLVFALYCLGVAAAAQFFHRGFGASSLFSGRST